MRTTVGSVKEVSGRICGRYAPNKRILSITLTSNNDSQLEFRLREDFIPVLVEWISRAAKEATEWDVILGDDYEPTLLADAEFLAECALDTSDGSAKRLGNQSLKKDQCARRILDYRVSRAPTECDDEIPQKPAQVD